MSRLPISKRIARRTRALVVRQARNMCEVYSSMWFAYNLTFIYAMARLALDDTPTSLARRDVTAFFSPQDCVNFLRFTQSQVRERRRATRKRRFLFCISITPPPEGCALCRCS